MQQHEGFHVGLSFWIKRALPVLLAIIFVGFVQSGQSVSAADDEVIWHSATTLEYQGELYEYYYYLGWEHEARDRFSPENERAIWLNDGGDKCLFAIKPGTDDTRSRFLTANLFDSSDADGNLQRLSSTSSWQAPLVNLGYMSYTDGDPILDACKGSSTINDYFIRENNIAQNEQYQENRSKLFVIRPIAGGGGDIIFFFHQSTGY